MLDHGGVRLAKIRAERHWVQERSANAPGAWIFGMHDGQLGAAARTRPERLTGVQGDDLTGARGLEPVQITAPHA